ncbi:proton-conducting transporter membrane subunit [Nonomuraea basaltis]|uniref:proton-conducting transporter transmembrane domain-containing protein n=1 Tax=Nonomuraea basaltis TaxID=2495887 RepID=UPI00110C40B5|nr:proton-conducting transporter membrane subunit [Nonomuraea basaltis]TMR90140.1 hydrogenase [Nonomuraea basaltis]
MTLPVTFPVAVMVFAPVLMPLLAACGYAVLGWNRVTAWLGALAAAALLAAAVVSGIAVSGTGQAVTVAGLARMDALSAFMLVVIGAVALLATLASPAYLAAELAAGHTTPRAARRYGVLTQAFIAAMALAVLASNLGVMWVAIEATTILTAFLVGFHPSRQATEAAWKYVVICSAGIVLAFLGIVLVHYAALHAGLTAADALDGAALARHAADLDPGVMRIAAVLLVLGFGTKAGLAPMHAWLPDAHSQAPAPVSALMSGVLLSVAFYAILRIKVIADVALGPATMRVLLVAAALASLAVAAALLLAQRDYKRLLAYSSIEHMGLIALGAAIGTELALVAVLLHILGHGLGKSALFLSSGHIHQALGSSRIDAARGLALRSPLLAGAFGAGLLALLGLPPFSLFASEVGIVRAGFAAGLGWAIAAALLLMLVIVAAIGRHGRRMLLGSPATAAAEPLPFPRTAALAVIAALVACALLGITVSPLGDLLHGAAAIAGGTS